MPENNANSSVLYSVEGSVARITLNRPEKRNALNDELISGIKLALHTAGEDDNVRVVLITDRKSVV